MLQHIIDFSVKNKLIIGLLVLVLVGWGGYQMTRLPIDAVPDITDNQVQVITVSPALGAPDVERLITFPIEQACSNIPGLKEIRSFSRFGLSVVTIVFDDDTDVYWARQQIAERLQQVQNQIPQGVGTPELAPVTTGLGEIYQYVLRPKPGYEHRYDAMSLRTIQDWVVRRQLLGTPGVADVSTFGGLLKQYEVSVRPTQLHAHGLTVADVFRALENNNQNAGGAYIEKGPNVLFIRTEGLIGSVEDLKEIPVKTLPGGVALRIRDIADVRFGHATRYGAVCYNDEGEVVGAVVMMLKGENSSAVVRRVKERIEQIRRTLPEGVTLEPFLDRTKMVNNAIATVEQNLLEGALIVVFVLVFFLGNMRAGLVVASVIPLSMLFAVGWMNVFGVSGNLMSLGAIDFGLIVDGAVIVVEAVMHRLGQMLLLTGETQLSRQQIDGEVRSSAGRMMNAAVFGQLIILIVYLPILTLEGIEGKMFRPMAQTVSFAVLGALLLSVTYVPAVSALFLSHKQVHKRTWSDHLIAISERYHQRLLEQVLRRPGRVLALSFGLFAGALVVLLQLGGEFIPELEEGDFAVDTRVLTGSSLHTTIEATRQTAGLLLRHFPEVEKVVTKIGSGEIPTDPMPIEAADMMVILKDKKEWTSARSFDELAEKMAERLQAIPGVTTGFQYPVRMRFNELMTGARQDVVCKIFGEDLDTLAHYARRLGEIIQRVEGARDLYVERITGMPQIVVRYRREAMARYGLSIGEVNRLVSTAFAGSVAGLVYEGERRFELVVRLADSERRGIEDVRGLLIPTPAGAQVPLDQLAEVYLHDGPNQIQREDAKRRITVGFNVRGRDVQSIVEEVQQQVARHLPLPPAYYITYGGAFENIKEAKERLSVAVPLALLLIFALLYFAFGSLSQGILIFTAIPLSAIGGIAALWLRDMPFSISAGVGFIALFGISVLNGIVLIAEFNRLRKGGWDDPEQIVRQGTRTRLRPVLMTATVASLGFLPMALSTGEGAEVQRPLATVVIGGLISAGLLTLVVLPVLYVLWSRWAFRLTHSTATVAVLLGVLFGAGTACAQPAVTLAQAMEQVLATHPMQQDARLGVRQAERLVGTANELPPLEAELELGQINAKFFDSRLFLRQSFYLPAVYRARRRLLQQQQLGSEAERRQQERELGRQLKSLYYNWLILQEKSRLWNELDSLYRIALPRAEQRLRTGESNAAEKSAIEMQRLLTEQQYRHIEIERGAVQRSFYSLLGREAQPAPTDLLYPLSALGDALSGERHPLWKAQQQRLEAAAAERQIEQSRLLPTLSVGYTNLSITGWQQDRLGRETYYGPTARFSTVTLGAQLPLFTGAQRSRIAAAELQVEREYQRREALERSLQTGYQNARERFVLLDEQVRRCQEELALQWRTLLATAERQLQAGEINYIDWLFLVRQTFEVRLACLDWIAARNEAAFDVEYWR